MCALRASRNASATQRSKVQVGASPSPSPSAVTPGQASTLPWRGIAWGCWPEWPQTGPSPLVRQTVVASTAAFHSCQFMHRKAHPARPGWRSKLRQSAELGIGDTKEEDTGLSLRTTKTASFNFEGIEETCEIQIYIIKIATYRSFCYQN